MCNQDAIKHHNQDSRSLSLEAFASRLMLDCLTMRRRSDIHNPTTSTSICSKQQCENGCPSIPISHNLTQNDLIENSFRLTNHQNTSTTCICPENCNTAQNCTHFLTDVREFVHLRHMGELKNPYDPCETFFCKNGTIGIHMATCTPVNCPIYHRIRPDGECCDVCDEQQSTFCDESRDCDIACRFSFVRDENRNCDLCKCTRPTTTTTTTTTTSTTTEEPSTTSIDDVEAMENEPKIFFFFFSSESDFINYLFIVFMFIAALAFACFLALVIWFLHRRIYNRVPLISHRSYKITQQYA
ncbi:hypothetical protein ACKWTF_015356 [Chironomus riparius]